MDSSRIPPNHPIPDARSGHSLLPCSEGAVIYGGYTKIKAKKGLQKGKVLNDCWILKMKSDPKAVRFERRKNRVHCHHQELDVL